MSDAVNCKWRGQNKKLVFRNFADLHIEFFFAHETKQGKVASKVPSIFHYSISFGSPCIRFPSKSHFVHFLKCRVTIARLAAGKCVMKKCGGGDCDPRPKASENQMGSSIKLVVAYISLHNKSQE